MPGRALRAAAILSLVAGAIHGILSPAHFEVWAAYGLFFVAASLGQIVWGLALLTDALDEAHWGPSWPSAQRALVAAGLVGNLLLFLVYLASRTVGVPLGPDRGVVEPVGVIDVIVKVFEAVIVVVCAAALARRD